MGPRSVTVHGYTSVCIIVLIETQPQQIAKRTHNSGGGKNCYLTANTASTNGTKTDNGGRGRTRNTYPLITVLTEQAQICAEGCEEEYITLIFLI